MLGRKNELLLLLLLAALDHRRARDVTLLVDEIQEPLFLLDADLSDLLGLTALLVTASHCSAGHVSLLINEVQETLFLLDANLSNFLSHSHSPPFNQSYYLLFTFLKRYDAGHVADQIHQVTSLRNNDLGIGLK